MRTTQLIGHTHEVETFLMLLEKMEGVALTCIGEITGMFGEKIRNLYSYTIPEGEVWEEFIQAEPWSSGPMIFLAIKNSRGEIKGWDDEWIEWEYEYRKGTFLR